MKVVENPERITRRPMAVFTYETTHLACINLRQQCCIVLDVEVPADAMLCLRASNSGALSIEH